MTSSSEPRSGRVGRRHPIDTERLLPEGPRAGRVFPWASLRGSTPLSRRDLSDRNSSTRRPPTGFSSGGRSTPAVARAVHGTAVAGLRASARDPRDDVVILFFPAG